MKAVTLAVALLLASGCSGGHSSAVRAPEPSYGTLPSFLPTQVGRPDSELTGTAAKPALTTEGDSVRVQLAAGSVHATVSGPVVPGEGLAYQGEATMCTWTVTVTAASRPVPIRAADFTATDHLGVVFRPTLVPGRPAPPAVLEPGATTTFELHARMTVGEGLMSWAPEHGATVASWDFEVEND